MDQTSGAHCPCEHRRLGTHHPGSKITGRLHNGGDSAALLHLNRGSVGTFDTSTKVNPPLRSAKDVEAIKEGLRDGTLDVIASGPRPSFFPGKDVEYDEAAFGIIGLETALPLRSPWWRRMI